MVGEYQTLGFSHGFSKKKNRGWPRCYRHEFVGSTLEMEGDGLEVEICIYDIHTMYIYIIYPIQLQYVAYI